MQTQPTIQRLCRIPIMLADRRSPGDGGIFALPPLGGARSRLVALRPPIRLSGIFRFCSQIPFSASLLAFFIKLEFNV